MVKGIYQREVMKIEIIAPMRLNVKANQFPATMVATVSLSPIIALEKEPAPFSLMILGSCKAKE